MKAIGLLLGLVLSVSVWAGSLDQARELIESGEHRQATELLKEPLADAATKAEALVLMTRAYNELEEHKPALDYGEQAIEALPESSDAHLEYARALRIKMQNSSKIKAMWIIGSYKKELRRALELNPDNVGARTEQIGFLIHAPGIAGGDTEEARKKIADLKSLDWRSAMFLEAELYGKEGNDAGILETYEKMVEKDPEDSAARMNLAFRLQRAERFPESDEHFEWLRDADHEGRSLMARYQLARSRVLGEYEQENATKMLLDYIERIGDGIRGIPSASSAYWRLGNAYEQLDRKDEAHSAYRKAIELDGDNDEAKKSLRQMGRS